MDSKTLYELVNMAADKESAVTYGFRQAKIELRERMMELEAQAGSAHAVLQAIQDALNEEGPTANAMADAHQQIRKLVEDYFASE